KNIDQPMKSVPPGLKSKVMNDIAIAKLLMELAELFSYNLGDVIETVMRKREKN
ncbi:MAG: hypothetical protein ACI9OT_002249, partial [Gammaproteobacteria bacterium]